MAMVLQGIAALSPIMCQACAENYSQRRFFPLEKLPKGKCPVCKIKIFHGKMHIFAIFLPFCLSLLSTQARSQQDFPIVVFLRKKLGLLLEFRKL